MHLGDLGQMNRDLSDAEATAQLPEHHSQLSIARQHVQSGNPVPNMDLMPFQVPPSMIYRPNPEKLKNAPKKDLLGSSKVIASTTLDAEYSGFSGARDRNVSTLDFGLVWEGCCCEWRSLTFSVILDGSFLANPRRIVISRATRSAATNQPGPTPNGQVKARSSDTDHPSPPSPVATAVIPAHHLTAPPPTTHPAATHRSVAPPPP